MPQIWEVSYIIVNKTSWNVFPCFSATLGNRSRRFLVQNGHRIEIRLHENSGRFIEPPARKESDKFCENTELIVRSFDTKTWWGMRIKMNKRYFGEYGDVYIFIDIVQRANRWRSNKCRKKCRESDGFIPHVYLRKANRSVFIARLERRVRVQL